MAGAAEGGFGDVIDESASSELDLGDYDLPHLERRLDLVLGFLRQSFIYDLTGVRQVCSQGSHVDPKLEFYPTAKYGPMCCGSYGSFVRSQKRALRYEELKCYSMAFTMLEDAKSLTYLADQMQNQEANVGTLQLDGTTTFSNGASLLEECLAQANQLRDTSLAYDQYKEAERIFRSTAITNERIGKPEVAVLAYKCLEFTYMRIVSLLSTVSTNNGFTSERSSDARHELKKLINIGGYARCAIDAGETWHQVLEYTALHQQISQECMSSIKKVLECDHHDTERFIHLVNLALKEIGT